MQYYQIIKNQKEIENFKAKTGKTHKGILKKIISRVLIRSLEVNWAPMAHNGNPS
jgi:hypothetical protein